MQRRTDIYSKRKRETWVSLRRQWVAAYIEEKVSHAIEFVVKGSQDFGLLDGAVWCMSQLFVTLEHGSGVTPAHLLQVVKIPWAPVIIPSASGTKFDLCLLIRHRYEEACRYGRPHTCCTLWKQLGCAGTAPLSCSEDSSYRDICRHCGCARLWKWNLLPPTHPRPVSAPGYQLLAWCTTSSGSLSEHPLRYDVASLKGGGKKYWETYYVKIISTRYISPSNTSSSMLPENLLCI